MKSKEEKAVAIRSLVSVQSHDRFIIKVWQCMRPIGSEPVWRVEVTTLNDHERHSIILPFTFFGQSPAVHYAKRHLSDLIENESNEKGAAQREKAKS